MSIKRLIAFPLSLILVLQITGCTIPFSSSINTEKSTQEALAKEKAYQSLVQQVKATNWQKADQKVWSEVDNSIQELQNYQDTPIIARYINYLKAVKENNLDNAIGIVNNIPVNYNGELKDQISKIRLEAKNFALAKDLKRYEELVRQGDYDTLRKETVEKVSIADEYMALYSYLSALEYQKKGMRSAVMVSLSHIPTPYKGLLATKINQLVNQNAAEIQITRNTLAGKGPGGKPKPMIGMTSEEVLSSAWGKPDSVNVMNTTTGKQEQWEYNSGQVVFIDNGFVSAVQY